LEETALGPAAEDVALRVAEFRGLREVVCELFTAAADGRPLPAEAVERLNGVSAAVPTHAELRLAVSTGPAVVEVAASASPTARVLSAIARSAIGLLGTDARERLRVCQAPGCGRFFLCRRPDQVWCSEACGNRARVARHAARRRSGSAPGAARPRS
jgi:predicted RNA-binding Zn ribbon-like protein